MLRASTRPARSDSLVKLLKKTAYGVEAETVARLFREMLRSYHGHPDDSDDDGATVTTLSDQLLSAIPTARRVRVDGLYQVYEIKAQGSVWHCTWREILAKGGYNHVYFADLVDTRTGRKIPAVVRMVVRADGDLRVYLLENALHAILASLDVTKELVAPFRFPFKVRTAGFPEYRIGSVLDDPGRNSFGDWVEEVQATDDIMFELMIHLAWLIYRAQKAVRFEHRDFKWDNVLIVDDQQPLRVQIPELQIDLTRPPIGVRCVMIDFGMARLEYSGEYLACDCLRQSPDFNACHDMQTFCYTMMEDLGPFCRKHAPRFGRWLNAQCQPIDDEIKRRWPDYELASVRTKHHRVDQVVSELRLQQFSPGRFIREVQRHLEE